MGRGTTTCHSFPKQFSARWPYCSLGAVQLAFGHDLADRPAGRQRHLRNDSSSTRFAPPSPIAARGLPAGDADPTIVLRLDSLADTSVLVRMPVARPADKDARNGSRSLALKKSGDRKTAVACEPLVSVLTEIAKRCSPAAA